MAKRKNPSLPVKDATRRLILHITANDIKGAKRADNSSCAAANALCRQEHFKSARVFKTMTYVEQKDGTMTRYVTPKSLYIEIMIFDRGGRMEAGDYIFEPPTGIKKLGAHYKPKGKRGQTGRPARSVHLVPNVRDNAPKGRGSLQALFK